MAIGSDMYSEEYLASCVAWIRNRSVLILMLLAFILLFLSGLTNLLEIRFFGKLDFNYDSYSVMFVILGGIYVVESFVLILNCALCMSTMMVLICIIATGLCFIVGIYLIITLEQWDNAMVLFPLVSDLIVIPILIYALCNNNRPMITDQHRFVLLEDSDNNAIILPNSSNNILTNLNHKAINTAGLDIGEDDSNLLSGSSNKTTHNEDDEKAEVLIFDTPGENVTVD